jgi:predicted TPR repeat methyltransferase
MQGNSKEIEEFWDDFAQEYEEIRQESVLSVGKDLTEFLLAKKILPNHSFLDMAGGTGEYLFFFQNYVENYTLVDISSRMLEFAKKKATKDILFVHSDQQTFLENALPYNVVFSAMNPVLKTKEAVLNLMELAAEWFLLFRLIQDEDTLFSEYETTDDEGLQLNKRYKSYFEEEQVVFQTKQFTYQEIEVISRDFFFNYFATEFSTADLSAMIQQRFGKKDSLTTQRKLTYELIYINKSSKQK